MAYQDDKDKTYFPTRDGEALGAAGERKMLTKLNDTDSFRSERVDGADGSIAQLRTKGGMPQFKVTPGPGDDGIFGPLTRPAVNKKYHAPLWHDETDPESQDRLVSSDGVIGLDTSQLKRISYHPNGRTEGEPLVHLCFASEYTPAGFAVADEEERAAWEDDNEPKAYVLKETAWTDRTWYDTQTAYFIEFGLVGTVRRLKSIKMRLAAIVAKTKRIANLAGRAFVWTFLGDTPPGSYDTVGSLTRLRVDAKLEEPPLHINAAYNGMGRNYRLAFSGIFESDRPRLASLYLALKDHLSKYTRIENPTVPQYADPEPEQYSEMPYGLLPAVRDSFLSWFTAPTANIPTGTDLTPNATDLSQLLCIGQPYHGLCTPTKITDITGAETRAKPLHYAKPERGNTRYFKSPFAPGEPDMDNEEEVAKLPPNYVADDWKFKADVVLCGGTMYAPDKCDGGSKGTSTKGAYIGPLEWLHVDNLGIVRVLGLVRKYHGDVFTVWDVVNYGATHGGMNDGKTYHKRYGGGLKLGGFGKRIPDDQAQVLGRIVIETTDQKIVTPGPYYPKGGAGTPSASRFGATGDVDIQVRGMNITGSGDHVGQSFAWLTTNTQFMVEATSDGREIAVMRCCYYPDNPRPANMPYYGMELDLHSRQEPDSINSHDLCPVLILTVATVSVSQDLTGAAGEVIGRPEYQFQWETKPFMPEDGSETWSEALGVNGYSMDSFTGTPFTRTYCRGFCYKRNDEFLLVTYQEDFGPTGYYRLAFTIDGEYTTGLSTREPGTYGRELYRGDWWGPTARYSDLIAGGYSDPHRVPSSVGLALGTYSPGEFAIHRVTNNVFFVGYIGEGTSFYLREFWSPELDSVVFTDYNCQQFWPPSSEAIPGVAIGALYLYTDMLSIIQHKVAAAYNPRTDELFVSRGDVEYYPSSWI